MEFKKISWSGFKKVCNAHFDKDCLHKGNKLPPEPASNRRFDYGRCRKEVCPYWQKLDDVKEEK